jgi:hypothetical protein
MNNILVKLKWYSVVFVVVWEEVCYDNGGTYSVSCCVSEFVVGGVLTPWQTYLEFRERHTATASQDPQRLHPH